MMKKSKIPHEELFSVLVDKSSMKQQVYASAIDAFKVFKSVASQMADEYKAYPENNKLDFSVPLEVEHHSDFEFSMRFGGDTLVFILHTNIFEIPRDHKVMKTKYIQDDPTRSYCGIIHVYNFLSDSFKYNRVNDLGYLIGRIFVNGEKHYFIDGKSELGFQYNNFRQHKIDVNHVDKIIESAIRYTLSFDLLIPPYEQVKLLTVEEMKSTINTMSLKTGKRLGFKFYSDQDVTD